MKYGGIWALCLCTFIFLGCVLLLGLGPREITRELIVLEGQPPSISEQLNLIGNHFGIIFIFKPKLGNPKMNCLGLLSASLLNVFFLGPYSDTQLWLGD